MPQDYFYNSAIFIYNKQLNCLVIKNTLFDWRNAEFYESKHTFVSQLAGDLL
jgi:hypothetical protein